MADRGVPAEVTGRPRPSRRRTSVDVVIVADLAVLLLSLALLAGGVWWIWNWLSPTGGGRLPARQRTELAQSIARARWAPAHDELDGVTRVLLRRSYTGLDGLPAVLEER